MTVPDFYNLQFKLHLAVPSTHIWVSLMARNQNNLHI